MAKIRHVAIKCEDGTARATCTRSVAADPIRTYAAIKSGTLMLNAIPVLDQKVGGEMRVTFDDAKQQVMAGGEPWPRG